MTSPSYQGRDWIKAHLQEKGVGEAELAAQPALPKAQPLLGPGNEGHCSICAGQMGMGGVEEGTIEALLELVVVLWVGVLGGVGGADDDGGLDGRRHRLALKWGH